MQDGPIQVIVAAFNDPDQAGQLMAELKEGKREGLVGIIDAAVVVKDSEGKLKITDSKRRSTRGFLTGGVVGGVIGLLAGPVGLAALGAGAIGALMGKMRGAPLKAEMSDIGSALTPNSSAIVAVIEHTWVSALEEALEAEGARIVQEALKADIAEQLNAGGSVLYSAREGAVGRIAESPEGMEVSSMVFGEDGILITEAQFTNEEADTDELSSGE